MSHRTVIGIVMTNVEGPSGLEEMFRGYPRVLTVPEVAELLRMTKTNIYRWLKDGTIPAYKLGSSWFIPRDGLREALEAGSNANPNNTKSLADLPLDGDPDEEVGADDR